LAIDFHIDPAGGGAVEGEGVIGGESARGEECDESKCDRCVRFVMTHEAGAYISAVSETSTCGRANYSLPLPGKPGRGRGERGEDLSIRGCSQQSNSSRPLSPTLSPEYREEGANAVAVVARNDHPESLQDLARMTSARRLWSSGRKLWHIFTKSHVVRIGVAYVNP
jgi:hypothetical protein